MRKYIAIVKNKVSVLFRNAYAHNELKDVSEARLYLENIHPIHSYTAYAANPMVNLSKMPECDLSIIMTAYNAESWIDRSVMSVLKQQTQYSYQLIVVDDGSTDKTGMLLDEIENSSLAVIHQNNSGISVARNNAIKQSVGKYIMFVDADDILLPGAIDALLDVALPNDADVVAGGYYRYDDNLKELDRMQFENKIANPRKDYYGQPWGKVYKRNIFEHLMFPEGCWFEDSIFAQIVWPMSKKCYCIDAIVYGYYNNQSSVTHIARGNDKSLDSLYVAETLFRERELFNIGLTDEDYEYFLRMVKLTYKRNRLLKTATQEAIFICQCEDRMNLFPNYSYNGAKKELGSIERALKAHDFRKYLSCCEAGLL